MASIRWRTIRALALVPLAGAVLCGVASGQYARHGDGRMFDANPQIGGDRYNFARPSSPLLLGNAYATGNVRGGLALRSFSPISDPTAFRGNLGSDTLSTFLRDSVSVADSATPFRPFSRRTFYDPAVTVPTGSYLRSSLGLAAPPSTYGPGSPLVGAGVPISRPGGTPLTERESRIPALTNASTRYGAMGTELSSSLFGPGLSRELGGEDARGPAGANARTPGAPMLDLLNRELLRNSDRPAWEEPTRSVGVRSLLEGGTREPIGRPMDLVMRPETSRGPEPIDPTRIGDAARAGEGRPEQPRPSPIAGVPSVPPFGEAGRRAAGQPEASIPRAHLLAGYDLFTDLRMAMSLSRDGRSAWWSAMQESARSDPTVSRAQLDVLSQDSDTFKQRMLAAPLRSFAGAGEAPINDALREAERLMGQGRFFDAAARYQQAQSYDPLNPLPLIGRGHALLAAGDYLQASIYIVRGLERFPEMARFSIDLATLLGGGEIVDIRRADLVQQLRLREDSRLRFLLGYLEYHAGMKESGLANLEKAAGGAEPGSIIWRYPTMLRGSGALPPPRISPEAPAETAPVDAPEKPPGETP